MNHIGNVIRELRLNLGMSQKVLAEGICSGKYIYLIEKGERSPSIEMTEMLSDKLGEDLFEYNQYLNCFDPISVNKKIKLFNEYRRSSDFTTLAIVTNESMKLPDFNHEPWIYEIQVNHLSYRIFIEQKFIDAIDEINYILHNVNMKYKNRECIANLYILLSTSYQAIGDIVNGEKAVLAAFDIIQNKKKSRKYNQIVISTYLNMMTMYYFIGEYDKAIELGLELNHYQLKMDSYERAHFTSFYLSYSYYEKGNKNDAITWFVKGLYLLAYGYKPMDVYYISTFKPFNILINDQSINPELIKEIKKIYKL